VLLALFCSHSGGFRRLASEYGASGLFGHMDYVKAKEQGYSDQQISDWMRKNPSLVHESNRPGQAGGLYEQVARGQVDTTQAQTREWADAMKTFQSPGGDLAPTQVFKGARAYEGAPQISATFGASEKYFGDEDLKAARMSGYSDQAIKDFLEENISLLRGPNVPGGSTELGQMTAEFKQPEPQASGGGSNEGPSLPFETGAGASAEYFGHADVDVAKQRAVLLTRRLLNSSDRIRICYVEATSLVAVVSTTSTSSTCDETHQAGKRSAEDMANAVSSFVLACLGRRSDVKTGCGLAAK